MTESELKTLLQEGGHLLKQSMFGSNTYHAHSKDGVVTFLMNQNSMVDKLLSKVKTTSKKQPGNKHLPYMIIEKIKLKKEKK